jgi:hypothetical protein
MGMSAGPLRACVNYDDCYDPFSASTLTCAKLLGMMLRATLPPQIACLKDINLTTIHNHVKVQPVDHSDFR